MVSDVWSLGLVSADDGYIVQSSLLSSFVDNRAAAGSKLFIEDEILHPLWKKQDVSTIFVITVMNKLSR